MVYYEKLTDTISRLCSCHRSVWLAQKDPWAHEFRNHLQTHFVGIFNSRRVPFRASIGNLVEEKSEDGLKHDAD